MRKGLYIIGLLLLLFVACTGDREVMSLLERAEAYLPEYPDSASMLLDSISSRPLRESGERARSLYGLLRTMTDAMTGKGVTTDSLIRPSYSYYKEQGTSYENIRRLGRSAFYLAQFEASRDSTKRAEDLFREAIRCSEKVKDWLVGWVVSNAARFRDDRNSETEEIKAQFEAAAAGISSAGVSVSPFVMRLNAAKATAASFPDTSIIP